MKQYLLKLIDGASLTQEETHSIMLNIIDGKYNDQQIAALLMAIQARKHIDLDQENTLDIVGTGGDGKNTFNISTCSAFVIAGAGYKVTKHGNGGSSSVSGASNVLQEHGVKFTDNPDILRRSLDEAGVCYFHAPLFAYGMKFVGPTRKALAIPTCFNLLGPLVNPCHPKNSLHGTATQAQLRLYVNIHQRIGDNFGVITSYDGYDEISLTSGFKVVTNFYGNTIQEAKAIFDNVLEGKATDAQKSVIIANAACGIGIMDRNMSIEDSVAAARESLESGRALAAFRKFVEINQ